MESPLNKTIGFAKDVVTYFMDFLETDFHKRRNPKRSIKLRSDDNLLLGFNLSKYPNFNSFLFKLINASFRSDSKIEVKKGQFTKPIPADLLKIIKLRLEKLEESELLSAIKIISSSIYKHADKYDLPL